MSVAFFSHYSRNIMLIKFKFILSSITYFFCMTQRYLSAVSCTFLFVVAMHNYDILIIAYLFVRVCFGVVYTFF